MAEEEVHGHLKLRVGPDENDHPQVPHQHGDVHKQKNPEEQLLQVSEAQEDKLGHARVVSPPPFSWASTEETQKHREEVK